MSLSEVNFYVVKALLNLYPIKEANGNVLTAFNQIFAQLHGVLKNYIRGSDAMKDCLKAIEVCFDSYSAYLHTCSHLFTQGISLFYYFHTFVLYFVFFFLSAGELPSK